MQGHEVWCLSVHNKGIVQVCLDPSRKGSILCRCVATLFIFQQHSASYSKKLSPVNSLSQEEWMYPVHCTVFHLLTTTGVTRICTQVLTDVPSKGFPGSGFHGGNAASVFCPLSRDPLLPLPHGHGRGFLMCISDPSHQVLSCFRKNFILFIFVILTSVTGCFAYNKVPKH